MAMGEVMATIRRSIKWKILISALLWTYEIHGKATYILYLEGIELSEINTRFLKDSWIRVNKLNETTPAMNAQVTLLQDLAPNYLVHFRGYEKFSVGSKYQEGLVNFLNIPLKDAMMDKPYQSLVPYSNLPNTPPVLQGKYKIDNYVIDENMLPAEFPGKNWRLNITITTRDKKEVIATVAMYLQVQRKSFIKKFLDPTKRW